MLIQFKIKFTFRLKAVISEFEFNQPNPKFLNDLTHHPQTYLIPFSPYHTLTTSILNPEDIANT